MADSTARDPGFLDGPVLRPATVADAVFTRLRDAVLSGELTPGDPLPGERDLAVSFGVNRHAVREALRRLEQVRLVSVRQGEQTRVLDWRRTSGLDLALGLVDGDVLDTPTLTRDMLEMRACLGADAARLAATRADDEGRDAVTAAVRAYDDAVPDLVAMHDADIVFWRAIIEASGNVAYLLTFNSLVSHALAIAPVPSGHRADELLDSALHHQLAAHVVEGRPLDAHGAATALLTRSIPELGVATPGELDPATSSASGART
jgi:GntR family transcriptional regulator, transcriptional repressor for pyruvate dehydrogenase complex